MNEENITDKESEIKPEVPESPENEAQQSKSLPKPRRAFFTPTLTLVFFLALIALAYFSWEQVKRADDMLRAQTNLELANNTLSDSLSETEAQLVNLADINASAEILLNQQNARLDSLNEELAVLRLGLNTAQGNDSNLILTEAASLLRLAERYLSLVQDLSVTRNLYQRSVNLLTQIDDPAVNRITALINSDMEALNSVESIDIQSVFLRISELSDQISLLNFSVGLESSDAFLNANSNASGEGFMSNVEAFFSRYFTIRKLDEPLQTPYSEQEIILLQQNLQLQLEQAKLASLQHRQDIYQDSISNVLRQVQQNVTETSGEKANFLRDLRSLQTESVVLENPRLSNAPGMLESLLANGGPAQ